MERKIFDTQGDTALALADHLSELIRGSDGTVTVALSGGSTPAELFSIMSERYNEKIDWKKVKIFWVDERCVPPDHSESNYKMTYERLLKKIDIPDENIFRVRGEDDPALEAKRYSSVINQEVEQSDDMPVFDILLLGMGSDGHTASIFPDQMDLLRSDKNCEIAIHPESGQKRITLTGPVIKKSRTLIFLVCGSGKREMLSKVLNGEPAYPASFIKPDKGKLFFYMDKSAAPLSIESE